MKDNGKYKYNWRSRKVINKLRPYLNRDGGDIELIDFKDGIVYVKMLGACAGCSMLDETLKDGVEQILMEEVPGVLGVAKYFRRNWVI